jgi:hypothetical protein
VDLRDPFSGPSCHTEHAPLHVTQEQNRWAIDQRLEETKMDTKTDAAGKREVLVPKPHRKPPVERIRFGRTRKEVAGES